MQGSTLKSMAKQPFSTVTLPTPPDEVLHSFSAPSSPTRKMSPEPMYMSSIGNVLKQTISNARQSPPSPQSPAMSAIELANKFLAWKAEPHSGHTNPDPLLYPERRCSTEPIHPFTDQLQNLQLSRSPVQESLPPLFPQANSVSDTARVLTPPTSISAQKQESVERAREEAIDESWNSNFFNPTYIRSKRKSSKWSEPKSFVLPDPRRHQQMLEDTRRASLLRIYNSDPRRYSRELLADNEENYHGAKKIGDRKIRAPGHTNALKPRVDNTQVLHTKSKPMRVRKSVKKQTDRSGTQEIKHRRTAVKKTKAQFNYDDIPDYTPPMASIPAKPGCFKAVWRAEALDLSNDPQRHLLHEAERELASKLRFPCDQYLKTKRRVFVGLVNNLIRHPHKQFGKTDAQQVGGVDVNKLSQLWEAYNSIGWFDLHHFRGHVQTVRNSVQVYDPKNTKWVDRKEFFGF